MKNQTSPLAPRRQRDYAGVLSSILAILAGLLVGLIVLLATNPSNAFPAFSALITGGFYSGMKTFGNVLYYAVPIIMTGLGVGFGFKASIFNIGGAGSITADGVKYELGYKDCLYITQGTKEVLFASEDAAKPAKFYMVSAPAPRSTRMDRSTAGQHDRRRPVGPAPRPAARLSPREYRHCDDHDELHRHVSCELSHQDRPDL